MEIEVGDYVRTSNNGIKRIDTIFENKTVNKYGYETGSDWDGKWYSYIKTTDITKHSKNIMDLVEVGDLIEIILNEITNETKILQIKTKEQLGILEQIPLKNIKTILTYRQYKNNAYEVEE